MSSPRRTVTVAVLVASTFALADCGSSGSSSTGKLSLNMTDAPVDGATSVVVAFTGIELQHSDGARVNIDFPTTRSIDLLALQNGATGALTQGEEVPAGDYDWMRLKVLADKNTQNESYITLTGGGQYPLYIPSGAETGLKLVRPFTVAQGSTTSLILDFNLRKSVKAPPGQDPNYILRPTLQLLDQLQVGKITVNVDLAALTSTQLGSGAAVSSCKAGMYLFSGASATPDDQDGDTLNDGGSDPIVYQPIVYDGANTSVSITIPFVATGSYTLAATCNFDVDSADTDDYAPNATTGQPGFETMKWTTVGNVSVTAGSTTTVAMPSS
jgi:hypothetical protein